MRKLLPILCVVLAATFALADACPTGGTIAQYEALTSCTIGDKTFSNFDFSVVTSGFATATFLINPFVSGNEEGFTLNGSFAALGGTDPISGTADVSLSYNVATTNGAATINDAFASIGGSSTSGVALVSLNEDLCVGGTLPPLAGGPCTGGTLYTIKLDDSNTSDTIFFGPVSSVAAFKDFNLVAFGSGSFAVASSVANGFSQTTPEPATLALLGSGLLLVGGTLRRKILKRD